MDGTQVAETIETRVIGISRLDLRPLLGNGAIPFKRIEPVLPIVIVDEIFFFLFFFFSIPRRGKKGKWDLSSCAVHFLLCELCARVDSISRDVLAPPKCGSKW